MRRRILIVLLALGTVGGYSSGVASLRYRSHCRKAAWMESQSRSYQTCPPCPATSAQAPTPSGPR
jgi:hypothetical protein